MLADMFTVVLPVSPVIQEEKKMIKGWIYIALGCVCLMVMQGFGSLSAQNKIDLLSGEVSYITGQNVYVKFSNTQGIENGDTLFVTKEEALIPALVVVHHSTLSCLCNVIGDAVFKEGDRLVAILKEVKNRKEDFPNEVYGSVEQDVNEQALTSVAQSESPNGQQSEFDGSLSLSSYSTFSENGGSDAHRFRHRLSMNAENISNSKLSAETYVSFTHRAGEWDVVKDNVNDALKIYALALRYDFNEGTSLWAGRRINPKIANVGAVDGLQFQKQWNSLYVGGVVGTRPDFFDYGYNADLLEYGAYLGHHSKFKNGFAQSSLAFFEQQNMGKVDRRFVYIQHSNTLLKDLVFFSSVEADLYALKDGKSINEFSLTGLYLSLSYRASRQLSLFTSYDNRKNVIYYETFRNYADEVLQRVSRQGLRFRVTYRPGKYLSFGGSAGTRYAETDLRGNNTFGANVTYNRVPLINASVTISGNLMQTSYLDGQIIGGRLSKRIINGKLYTSLNYRWIKFDYLNVSSQLKQHTSELDLSYSFNKNLSVSVDYEVTFQEAHNSNRLYLNLRKKF
jgi:hypothetical protein